MIIAIIIFTVVFIGIVSIVCVSNNKKLMESGKIVKRQMNFWENAETFRAAVSYEALRDAILSADFSDCAVTVTPDAEGQAAILFRCRHGWNALLRWHGVQDGRCVFRFHFPAWRTGRYGAPYGVNQMNMTETRVERIILSLDPNAGVESLRLQTRTKTRFI